MVSSVEVPVVRFQVMILVGLDLLVVGRDTISYKIEVDWLSCHGVVVYTHVKKEGKVMPRVQFLDLA